MGRVDRFLERRFIFGQREDDERFQDIPRIRHASSLGKCQRQNYYKLTNDTDDVASPYFELGNLFEDLYGAVLAAEYGDFTDDEVANLDNDELVEQCDRLLQDVTCNINLGESAGEEVVITGEADWVVLYGGEKAVDHVELFDDGRRVQYCDGTEEKLDKDKTTPIELVIETKTSNLDWRDKYGHKFEHEYQVRTYMWAFDAKGEITYMERDDFSEMQFEFTRDRDVEDDMEFRAKQLHMKLTTNALPDADPPREHICKYCDWKDQCKIEGGSRWD